MSDNAHERLLSDQTNVEETTDSAKMPLDWSFDPDQLKAMRPEEKQLYEIELAEKMRRLYQSQQELAVILSAGGIRHEGKNPRVIVDKILNPDKEEYQDPSVS